MSRTDLETVDFFSPELLECPFDLYRQLQDEAPVFRLHTWRSRYGSMIDRGFEYKNVKMVGGIVRYPTN